MPTERGAPRSSDDANAYANANANAEASANANANASVDYTKYPIESILRKENDSDVFNLNLPSQKTVHEKDDDSNMNVSKKSKPYIHKEHTETVHEKENDLNMNVCKKSKPCIHKEHTVTVHEKISSIIDIS